MYKCMPGYSLRLLWCRVFRVMQVLEDITGMALWMTIPLITEHTPAPTPPGIDTVMDDSPAETLTSSGGGDRAVGSVPGDGWELWNTVRTLCSYDQLLGCVLKLDKQVSDCMGAWTACFVSCCIPQAACLAAERSNTRTATCVCVCHMCACSFHRLSSLRVGPQSPSRHFSSPHIASS